MATDSYSLSRAVGLTRFQPAYRAKAEPVVKWGQIYTEATTQDGQIKYFAYAGFPTAEQVGMLGTIKMYDMEEVGEVTLTVVKFAIGTELARETLLDSKRNLPGLATEIGAMMGESHQQAIDQFCSQPFNRLTNTSYPVLETGVSVCSNSHTLIGGSTYDNLYDASSPTYENIWDDIIAYEWGFRTHNGLRTRDTVKKIMCNTSILKEVRKALENSVEPDTANRNDNFISGITAVVNPYLTSTTARIYLGSQFQKHAMQVWRERMQTEDEPVRSTQAVRWFAFQRLALGLKDFRPIALNPGQ